MYRFLRFLKKFIIFYCIITVFAFILIKACPSMVIGVFSESQPKFLEKIYPDSLSSINSVHFDKIDILDNSITLEGGININNLAVKRVLFNVVDDYVYVYVYKGILTKKENLGLNATYNTDMKKINRVVLVGSNGQLKELWKR